MMLCWPGICFLLLAPPWRAITDENRRAIAWLLFKGRHGGESCLNQSFTHFFCPMSDRDISLIAGPSLRPIALEAMSNKESAAEKDAEGKLESAYGELTGDTGHQIKGKAKQLEASAMNVAEDIKHGVQSAAQKVAGAAKKISEDLS